MLVMGKKREQKLFFPPRGSCVNLNSAALMQCPYSASGIGLSLLFSQRILLPLLAFHRQQLVTFLAKILLLPIKTPSNYYSKFYLISITAHFNK